MTLHTASPNDFTQQVLVPLAEWSSIWLYTEGDYVISANGVWVAVDPVLGVAPAPPNWTELVAGGASPVGVGYASPCLSIGTDTDNQVVLCGAVAGDAVSIDAIGSDASVPIWLRSKGQDASVFVSGGDATSLLVDTGGNNASILFTEPIPLSPTVMISNGTTPADGVLGLMTYGVFGGAGVSIRTLATQGAPDSPLPLADQNIVFHAVHWANAGTGSYDRRDVASYVVEYSVSGMTSGANQTWSARMTDGTGVDIIAFEAGNGALHLQGGTATIHLGNSMGVVSVTGGLTVSDRAGTPTTFACFDTDGKLVASAVACV